MKASTIGVLAGGAAAFGAGAFAATKLVGDRDPWIIEINRGPGSIEQIPSMLLPWGLPMLGAAGGAVALSNAGHPKLAAAAGIGAAALYGAGFTTWLLGRTRD